MSVYVDPLKDWGWRLGPSCHLTADSHEELVAFADSLGLKGRWIQRRGTAQEHFDLTKSKRKLAVSLGAVELSFGEAGEQVLDRLAEEWERKETTENG